MSDANSTLLHVKMASRLADIVICQGASSPLTTSILFGNSLQIRAHRAQYCIDSIQRPVGLWAPIRGVPGADPGPSIPRL